MKDIQTYKHNLPAIFCEAYSCKIHHVKGNTAFELSPNNINFLSFILKIIWNYLQLYLYAETNMFSHF